MAAAVEELPEELMTLIMSKLPVKSLLRFKCVQKSWYSLISSPYFIRLHRISTNNNDCFLVGRFIKQQNVLSLHSYETLEEISGNHINIPSLSNNRAWLCGSCDGLVCITNYKDQILIFNPMIREFRSLFVPPEFCETSDYDIESVAFGSDPNTGKYTVLMIGVPINSDNDDSDEDIPDGDREARLYDFSSGSWRETAVVIPGPFHYYCRAVSLNGAFHWCPSWDDNTNNILTFHMSNEVTELFPLPYFAKVTRNKGLCVSSKSQLSLILVYDFSGWFEICVMTEYGVKESWSRLIKIGHLPLNIVRPIVFWDEQRLLLESFHGQLVSCDLQHHQNLCHFPIHGDFDLYPYSQSLVSVNGIGKSMNMEPSKEEDF